MLPAPPFKLRWRLLSRFNADREPTCLAGQKVFPDSSFRQIDSLLLDGLKIDPDKVEVVLYHGGATNLLCVILVL